MQLTEVASYLRKSFGSKRKSKAEEEDEEWLPVGAGTKKSNKKQERKTVNEQERESGKESEKEKEKEYGKSATETQPKQIRGERKEIAIVKQEILTPAEPLNQFEPNKSNTITTTPTRTQQQQQQQRGDRTDAIFSSYQQQHQQQHQQEERRSSIDDKEDDDLDQLDHLFGKRCCLFFF